MKRIERWKACLAPPYRNEEWVEQYGKRQIYEAAYRYGVSSGDPFRFLLRLKLVKKEGAE